MDDQKKIYSTNIYRINISVSSCGPDIHIMLDPYAERRQLASQDWIDYLKHQNLIDQEFIKKCARRILLRLKELDIPGNLNLVDAEGGRGGPHLPVGIIVLPECSNNKLVVDVLTEVLNEEKGKTSTVLEMRNVAVYGAKGWAGSGRLSPVKQGLSRLVDDSFEYLLQNLPNITDLQLKFLGDSKKRESLLVPLKLVLERDSSCRSGQPPRQPKQDMVSCVLSQLLINMPNISKEQRRFIRSNDTILAIKEHMQSGQSQPSGGYQRW